MRIILSWRKFKKVFSFTPTAPRYAIYSYGVQEAEQNVVDTRLSELASRYQSADRSERQTAESLRKVVNAKALLAGRESLGWYQDALHRAKADFWYAHGLAKKAGFEVKPKYTDYLPSKYR